VTIVPPKTRTAVAAIVSNVLMCIRE